MTWARKNGIQINDWRAGEVSTAFSVDAWKAEGRAKPNAEEIIWRLLGRNDPHIEPILLVGALAAVGTERSVELLSDYTRDPWIVMRMHALWALGHIGLPEAFVVVADRFVHDEDTNCRANAALALGQIGDPRGIELIEKALADIDLKEKALEEVCMRGGKAEDEMELRHAKFLRRFFEMALNDLRTRASTNK